jgi:hypothetical protein
LSWERPFDDPIPLPGRRELVTLRDAGGYIAALPKIRKSSILFPEFSCAVSQRGFLPRPAQVSDGRAGFWNFGKTFG